MVRVRFAPSPTGFLHIGGLRTALYNELYALKNGGKLILRIEDTDQARFVPGAVENLIRTLAWAGVKPDEGPYLDEGGQVQQRGDNGPYIQSQRLDLYRKYADELLKNGRAYRCYCTAECLEEMKKGQATAGRPIMYDKRCCRLTPADAEAKQKENAPHVIRLRVPETGTTEFHDAIRGLVKFANATVDDQVLIKSDGFPTYHLANVVDDHLMAITHVIRGEEWLPSTPKHVLLYQAFGWQPPVFAHLPLLLNPDRSKLSKRQGDVAVEDYRKHGYLPEAIVNFIALLGWNPSGSKEIYVKDELVSEFALEKINKAGAVFNREKLDWLNREYIKHLTDDRLAELSLPFFVEAGLLRRDGAKVVGTAGDEDLGGMLTKVLSLERQRVDKLADLPAVSEFYFKSELRYDVSILPWKKSTPEVARERLAGLVAYAESLPEAAFSAVKELETMTLEFVAGKGWTNAESLWPMRVALTAAAASPSPFEVAWCLGKEKTVKRLKQALAALK
jgi:glutamyl-tRNA synthetase